MGCCGCTLQTSAIVAAVFGIIQSVVGFITGLSFLISFYRNYQYTPSLAISNAFISATIFNGLWLIASIILIIGIVKQNAAMHRVWVGATSVIMIVDLVHAIVIVVSFVNNLSYSYRYNSYWNTRYQYLDFTQILLFSLVLTAVTRGTVWLWIMNICLTIYTAHRANEIERGPVPSGATVFVYGNQPVQSYSHPGQTVIIHHGGPVPGGMSSGIPPSYDYQQQQYVQQQYGQPPFNNPYDPQPQQQQQQMADEGMPPKY